jgi:hypothetical protein
MGGDRHVVGSDRRTGLLRLESDFRVDPIRPGVERARTGSEANRSSALAVRVLEPRLRAPKRSSAATTMLVQTLAQPRLASVEAIGPWGWRIGAARILVPSR